MIQAGQALENPVQKERFTFLETSAETDGELVRCELVVGPGGGPSMLHVHPRQEERCEIHSGQGRFRLGREERLVGPGETVVAPPGTPHAFVNAGETDLSMILEFRPALCIAELLAAMCGLAARGELDAKGRPRPLQALAIGRGFRDETALPWVPAIVQRALLAVAAPLTRLADIDGHPTRPRP